MKIKELLKILQSAPDKTRDVYIPNAIIMSTSKSVYQTSSTEISHDFDDNNDLALYIINEE